MIEEIRDIETAEIAVRASLTGHLVLSTIHTNDAVKTITRLLDMKIEPFLIASSLSGIVSQRLVRRLCEECMTESNATASEKEVFARYGMEVEKLKRAKGCPTCNFKGYIGRTGVYEILEISESIRLLISEKASIVELEKEAKKQGMKSLMESCLEIVKKGVTTLEEVMKIALE
jgi:type IV pilus assembly protein PilB